jgi:hypothetical protein
LPLFCDSVWDALWLFCVSLHVDHSFSLVCFSF